MANTVDLNNIEEFKDSAAELDAKLDQLAALVREARSVVFYTGAGVSTGAGIPDYRGPDGCWTRAAQGRAAAQGTPLMQAVPTPAHMALVALERAGRCAAVVSSNVDGLHMRSGVQRLSELHGNLYKEVCWREGCGRVVLRGFDVQARVNGDGGLCADCRPHVPHFCHCTGRACDACGAPLKDSVIHFGENLDERVLGAAGAASEAADLAIVLGSSLTVSPACDLPRSVVRGGGKMVICNYQRTPLDSMAHLRLFADTTAVMTGLLRRLDVELPPFKVRKTLRLGDDGLLAAAAGANGDDVSDIVADVVFDGGAATAASPPFQGPAGAASAEVRFLPGTNQAPVTVRRGEDVEVATDAATERPHIPMAMAEGLRARRRAAAAAAAAAGTAGNADDAAGAIAGAVEVRAACPHVPAAIALPEGALLGDAAACAAEGCEAGELWLCLCGHYGCGRYAAAHAREHRRAAGCAVAVSLSDLSFWCDGCDGYVSERIPGLWDVYERLHVEKHGEAPPAPPSSAASGGEAEAEAEDGELTADTDLGGFASFVTNCPHVAASFRPSALTITPSLFQGAPCADCGSTEENWICLRDGQVRCSRYVGRHALLHSTAASEEAGPFTTEGHHLAVSLGDLNVWCFACDSYVLFDAYNAVRTQLEFAKAAASGRVTVTVS